MEIKSRISALGQLETKLSFEHGTNGIEAEFEHRTHGIEAGQLEMRLNFGHETHARDDWRRG